MALVEPQLCAVRDVPTFCPPPVPVACSLHWRQHRLLAELNDPPNFSFPLRASLTSTLEASSGGAGFSVPFPRFISCVSKFAPVESHPVAFTGSRAPSPPFDCLFLPCFRSRATQFPPSDYEADSTPGDGIEVLGEALLATRPSSKELGPHSRLRSAHIQPSAGDLTIKWEPEDKLCQGARSRCQQDQAYSFRERNEVHARGARHTSS